MSTNNTIEVQYAKLVSLEHRKKFAQFFTPYPIVELMVKWLLGNENLNIVLEPAFGTGIFTRELLSKKTDIQIKGFDVDDVIFDYAKNEFGNNEKIRLLLQDYMYNDWQNKYDGIICNPPYFKFHNYDNKNVLKEIENKLNCKLNGFTNLYTLFLLKSIHQLNQNGRCAYIIPSEFLNSDYGKLVKTHLLQTGTLRHIIVFDFETNIFDDVLTTSSIILCANDNKTDKVQFTTINSVDEFRKIEKIIFDYPKISNRLKSYSFEELEPNLKWKTYYQPQNGHRFKHLIPFSTYAKVVRGIATGANDYFIFNLSKAKEYAIKEDYLLPCICRSVDVKNTIFTKKDFDKLKNNNKNVFLINAIDAHNDNISKYIIIGEESDVDKKYLTASRNPWYSLEKRPPAPIWVSVFNRKGLRFIRNEANVANLTTFHCVYPQENLFATNINVDLLFAYLLTDTAKQIFNDNSREYGSGLQKFEPNDINKGKVLDLSKLSDTDKDKILELYSQYVNKNDKSFIIEVDKILIDNYLQ